MKKPMAPVSRRDFPDTTEMGVRWLDSLRDFTHDIRTVVVNVDPPSLDSNITTVQAITVPGVKVGDLILEVETTTFDDEYMMVDFKVTADNEVSLKYHRGKAGTYDPPAENMTIVYIKNTR